MRQSDPTSAARLRKGEGEEEETKNTTIPEGNTVDFFNTTLEFSVLNMHPTL